MGTESVAQAALSVAAMLIAVRILEGLSPENSLQKGIRLLLGGAMILTLLAPIPGFLEQAKQKKPPLDRNPSYEDQQVQQVLEGLCETLEMQLKRALEQAGCPAEEVRVICRENEKRQWEIAEITVDAQSKRSEISAVIQEKTGVRPVFSSG